MSEPLIENFSINYPCTSINFKIGYRELIDFYTSQEPQTKSFYCSTIKDDWNVVDVGANIGMFTLLFGKLTKQNVFAIEASYDNFTMLKRNLYENNYNSTANINCLNLYISNKTSKMDGEIHYLWTGRGSVARTKGEFEFTTLDDVLIPICDKIHLIKIDIDGYDFEAVQGCKKIIERDSPMIVIELVDEALRLHGYTKDDVINFMKSFNYSINQILDNCNYVFIKT